MGECEAAGCPADVVALDRHQSARIVREAVEEYWPSGVRQRNIQGARDPLPGVIG
jgi:hypothetical protein